MFKNTKYLPLTNEIIGETKLEQHIRASMHESKSVPDHKGNKMFQLGQRANLVEQK